MNFVTFEAKCRNPTCLNKFDAPELSCFSYGEYIYGSIDGLETKYYCGLNCEVWKFIDRIVSESIEESNSGRIGAIIQNTIGLVADRQNSNIYFTQSIYCPKCHSKISAINSNKKTGEKDFESLTFNNFNSLSDLKKKKLIESHISYL